MAATRQVSVGSQEQMDQAVSGYIAQGFVVMNRAPAAVTMFKKKEFSILWLVIGLLLCVVPLLVYLVVYALQQDQMVEIRVAAGPVIAGAGAVPIGAPVSDDGRHWWDGRRWQPVPAAGMEPPAGGGTGTDPSAGGGRPAATDV
jgi:hypothetical protein